MLQTQVQRGAANTGIDFASYIQTSNGPQLFLNEVSSSTALVDASRFTALGMGKGGESILRRNLAGVERVILRDVGEQSVRDALQTQLHGASAQIRLIGPQSFRVSHDTILKIEGSTGFQVTVLDELVKLP